MEPNAMAGGTYSNMGSGMLGLEMSLHHPHHHQLPPQQNPQNTLLLQPPPPHHPLVSFPVHHHDCGEPQQLPPPQVGSKQGYPFAAKSKNQTLTLSDEDEAGIGTENSADADGNRKMSPWQRMKWTDNMVRLLIMVVFYIGDEAGSEGNDPAGKKKGSGVLQKKGKWKSVSRAMMERGFSVSPQQCEDKFNDLNKRYKRVNDILGKGTSCKVVENQSLLDTMDHLSAKTKEEVKKLLNSKHLFFREMCAYHNSCGHGGTGSSGAGAGGAQLSQSPEVGAEGSNIKPHQSCLLSPGNAEGSKIRIEPEDDEDEDDDNENDDEDEDDDGDEENAMVEGGVRGHHHDHAHTDVDDNDDDDDHTPCERSSRKRQRKGVFLSPLIQQLSTELMNVFRDETKNLPEKRQWIKTRLWQLEEQHMGYQSEAFELEKQRLKWVKFSSKKEREMERDKLRNERMRLENERMVLLFRQKELELFDHCQQHHHSSRKSDPSSLSG